MFCYIFSVGLYSCDFDREQTCSFFDNTVVFSSIFLSFLTKKITKVFFFCFLLNRNLTKNFPSDKPLPYAYDLLMLRITDLEWYPRNFRSFREDAVSSSRQTCVSNLQVKHILPISITFLTKETNEKREEL